MTQLRMRPMESVPFSVGTVGRAVGRKMSIPIIAEGFLLTHHEETAEMPINA